MTACHDESSWARDAAAHPAEPGATAAATFRRIVVGVDGSPNSIAALRLAVGLATRDGGVVEAVCAYHGYVPIQHRYPATVSAYAAAGGVTTGSLAGAALPDVAATARRTLVHAMQKAFGRESRDNVALTPVEGSAHEVLTRYATHADLLVVGARGREGALANVVGSTAQACARHAVCPVLVVPAPDSTPAEPPD